MVLFLASALALFDWYGLADRVELYAALLVDAPSEEVEANLLTASRIDDRIRAPAWHWLRFLSKDHAPVPLLDFETWVCASRVDLYSALLVDAPSERGELVILRAARLDPRVTPLSWRWLHGIAAQNNRDRPGA